MRATEPAEVAQLLRGGAVIVDIRPADLAFARPIEGAVHLPLEKIQQGANPDVAQDATVIVVCAWGRKSALAGLYLEARGFLDVRHLIGGVAALPKEPQEPPTDATPGTEPR